MRCSASCGWGARPNSLLAEKPATNKKANWAPMRGAGSVCGQFRTSSAAVKLAACKILARKKQAQRDSAVCKVNDTSLSRGIGLQSTSGWPRAGLARCAPNWAKQFTSALKDCQTRSRDISDIGAPRARSAGRRAVQGARVGQCARLAVARGRPPAPAERGRV